MDNKQTLLLAQAKARAAGETQTQVAVAVEPVQKPVAQTAPAQHPVAPPQAPVAPPAHSAAAQVPVQERPAPQTPGRPAPETHPVQKRSALATSAPGTETQPVKPAPRAPSSREEIQTLAQMVQEAHKLRQKTRAMVSDAVMEVLEKRVSEAVGQNISYDRSKPQSTLSTGRLLELVVLTLLGIAVPEGDYAHEMERKVHAYLVSLMGSDLAEQSSTVALRQVKSALSDLEDQMSRVTKMVQVVGQESKEHRVVTEYLAYQQLPQSAVPRSVDDYHLDTDASFEQVQRVLRRQASTKVRQFQSHPEGARSRATPVRRAGSF